MRKLIFFLFVFICFNSFSQDKKIDQLEVYYAQAHYTKIIRKANGLLAKPEYDYSGMPTFYKSLALFRLAGQEPWIKRNRNTINDAISLYSTFLEYKDAEHYIKAHYYEIADLKIYLTELQPKLTTWGYKKDAEAIKKFVDKELKSITGYYKPTINDIDTEDNNSETVSTSSNSVRDKIVAYAKTFIGVKYVWAGSDPSGFDCSGYTSYVLKKFNILVTRTASGQLEGASKIKVGSAYKGDLVFFGHSGNITHVGLVISEKGDALNMIHASTSKGIIITNIDTSTYWKPKLKGAGKVV